jgi:hypothetical protein
MKKDPGKNDERIDATKNEAKLALPKKIIPRAGWSESSNTSPNMAMII